MLHLGTAAATVLEEGVEAGKQDTMVRELV